MKKTYKKCLVILGTVVMMASSIYAYEGEMGYFGGSSPGIKLPTLTSLSQSKPKRTSKYVLPYKENIYLSGKAQTVEGTIEVRPGKEMDKEEGSGTYTETYVIKAQTKDNTTRVNRTISFDTQYTYDSNLRQATKVSTVKKWTENVTANGQTYSIDPTRSSYSKSVLEDYTPGVLYYRGDVEYKAVYVNGEEELTMQVGGPIYGYSEAFAKTETQKRSITIYDSEGNGYYIEETPTYTVHRDIEYGKNEPDAISMAGNYKEIIRGEGVINYQILQGAPDLYSDEKHGSVNIQSAPSLEQLIVPTGLNVKGHPAESHIRKMYGMKVFTGTPAYFSANKIVTKAEYIKMLVTALQIPMLEEEKNSSPSPFSDLSKSSPYYPYAKAAFDAGLVGAGKLSPNSYLNRETMYTLNVRAIGLQRLGLGTMGAYTPFVDDKQISSWAKAPIYAASRLGIITPNTGYIYPKKSVTYGECAAFMDQLISYLRYDLQKDYSDKILLGY